MITWKTWLEKKVRCVSFLFINCINVIYVSLYVIYIYIYILEKSISMLCNAFIISAKLSSPHYLEKFRLRSSYHYWIFPLFKPRTYACFNNVIKCKPPIFLGIYCISVFIRQCHVNYVHLQMALRWSFQKVIKAVL